MNMTEEQLVCVRQWAESGMDLNAIQKSLKEVLGIHITYMETRFLLLDHGIEIRKTEEVAAEQPKEEPMEEEQTPATEGKLQVTVDEVQQPGMFLSGKVSFPSGATGSWFFDTMGQLSWEPGIGQPTTEEMNDFQKELGRILRSHLGQI